MSLARWTLNVLAMESAFESRALFFNLKNMKTHMKVTVYLTREGAIARKGSKVGFFGSDKSLGALGSALETKHALQALPVEAYMVVDTSLADFEGDIKERAAVGMGQRKKFARFIERVESNFCVVNDI